MANLIFNYSTMNSGKTLELIRKSFSYEENGFKVLVIKPLCDTKGENKIVSRIGVSKDVDILVDKNDKVLDLVKGKLKNIICILVDEAQFLTASQIDELNIISKFLDIEVICYGLRDNFKMKLFDGGKRLFEVADKLNSFDSRCSCGKEALFCARKVNDKYVVDGDEVVIDGASNDVTYEPMCGYCYLTKVENLSKEDYISYE